MRQQSQGHIYTFDIFRGRLFTWVQFYGAFHLVRGKWPTSLKNHSHHTKYYGRYDQIISSRIPFSGSDDKEDNHVNPLQNCVLDAYISLNPDPGQFHFYWSYIEIAMGMEQGTRLLKVSSLYRKVSVWSEFGDFNLHLKSKCCSVDSWFLLTRQRNNH